MVEEVASSFDLDDSCIDQCCIDMNCCSLKKPQLQGAIYFLVARNVLTKLHWLYDTHTRCTTSLCCCMVFCPGCTWSTSLHRCIGLLREGVAVRASLVADCIAQHRCIVFSAQTQFILGCIASDFFICLVQHVTMSHETGGVVLCSDESYCGRTLHFVLQRCTVALST